MCYVMLVIVALAETERAREAKATSNVCSMQKPQSNNKWKIGVEN